jgi:excinuclease UvrABC nuclease subunit
MKQLDENMQAEVVDLFKGIYSSDEKIEELKESIKTYNASKREMIKNTAEKLECVPLHIKKAYKQWVGAIQNPEEAEAVDGIIAFLQEFVSDKIDE